MYFRTVEMGRRVRFRCHRCGGVLDEELRRPTELWLTCGPCDLVVVVLTTEAIPRGPQPATATRYRLGGLLVHGAGIRCHNCGRQLLPAGKGGPGIRLKCPRCHSVHLFGSRAIPPIVPPSVSSAKRSPTAMPALSAPSP